MANTSPEPMGQICCVAYAGIRSQVSSVTDDGPPRAALDHNYIGSKLGGDSTRSCFRILDASQPPRFSAIKYIRNPGRRSGPGLERLRRQRTLWVVDDAGSAYRRRSFQHSKKPAHSPPRRQDAWSLGLSAAR